MSIKSERDAYKAMATHMTLALTSVAVSVAVGVGLYITHNAWCLTGLIIIGVAYSVTFDTPDLNQTKQEETQTP